VTIPIECDACGSDMEKYPSDVTEHNFCSVECYNDWQRENRGGGSEPGWKGGKKTATCEHCGTEYEDFPAKINRCEHTYCSRQCAGKGRMAERNVNCHQCGEVVDKPPRRTKRSERNFCSKECLSEWASEFHAGRNGPMWRGGESYHPRNYGPNWDEQRQKAIERAGHRCMMCDSTSDLVVHHKRPLRTFDRDKREWWETANSLDNLLTLCRSCHSIVHQNRKEYSPDYYDEGEV